MTFSGAESTIEALFSLLEVERYPEARRWIRARGAPPVQAVRNGEDYYYRVFSISEEGEERRIGLVMNLTAERLDVLEGDALERFLASF